jgi:ribulose-5-phosphate 4-epimerase/fuculose-1-phosphate aldolase
MADKPVLRKTGKKPYKSKSKEVKFYGDPAKKSPKKPYVVLRDVQNLQQRKRVSQLLQTESFISELEGILKNQVENNAVPKLRRPEKNTSAVPVPPPPPPMAHGSYSALSGRPLTHPLGITPINDLRGSLSSKYSVAERQERCKLAALYRLVDLFGLGDGIYGHISCRIPGHPDQMLLNPYGLLPSEITASNLVKVDLDGNIIDPGTTQYGINSAGLAIHSAILGARPDINCVCHVHGKSVVAVSTMECGLLPISQDSTCVGGVSYHDYHGIAAEDEKEMLARDLGDTNRVLMLRNHGLATTGTGVEEAFQRLRCIVQACEIQVEAMAAGLTSLLHLPLNITAKNTEICETNACQTENFGLFGRGELEFEAYMRDLDSKGYNTGYKYKGKHLMQPKSNVTAHKKPQEQKVREQLTKERKTGTEQQKPKRLSTSAGSLRRSGKKDEERKDTLGSASYTTRKTTAQKDTVMSKKGPNIVASKPATSKAKPKSSASVLENGKGGAEKTPKSSSQEPVAPEGLVSDDQKGGVAGISDQPLADLMSDVETQQNSQDVSLSPTHCEDELLIDPTLSSPVPVEGDCCKENEPANQGVPEDVPILNSKEVESTGLDTKENEFLDDTGQDVVKEEIHSNSRPDSDI